MFNKIKSWFTRIVAAEAHRCSESIILAMQEDYKRVIEDHIVSVFAAEKAKLEAHLVDAAKDVKECSETFSDERIACFEEAVNAIIEREHAAFKARLVQTFDSVTKDSPSHWKASDEDHKEAAELLKVRK